MIYAKQLNLVFIRVPKTGSVAVAKFFVDNVLSEGDQVSTFCLDPKAYTNLKTAPIYPPAEPFKIQEWKHCDNSHMDMQYAVDNGLVDMNNKPRIIGVVRNPFEKLLSLYFARLHRVYVTPSVHVFRNQVVNNFNVETRRIKRIGAWQRQHQWTFLQYNGEQVGEWWCYDNLNQHMEQLVKDYNIQVKIPFGHHNQSVKGVVTREYVDKFYDQETTDFMHRTYARDIELYERTKAVAA